MNNMRGIDPSCKYRVAPASENPLGGSEREVLTTFVQSRGHGDLHALPEWQRLYYELTVSTSMTSVMDGQFSPQTYLHAHCGAGFDPRMLSMGCHFPAKSWCVKSSIIKRYRTCKSLFCETCLWICKTKAEQAAGSLYPPSNMVIDTMLPVACPQDPSLSGALPNFKQSLCTNPLAQNDATGPSLVRVFP